MSFKSTDRLSNRIRLDVIRSNQKIWNVQTSTNQSCLKLGILPSHWLSNGIIDITHKSDDTSHHSCTKIRKLQVIRHSIDRMMLSHILTHPLNACQGGYEVRDRECCPELGETNAKADFWLKCLPIVASSKYI